MKNTNAITPVYSNLRAGQASVTWNGIYSYALRDSLFVYQRIFN